MENEEVKLPLDAEQPVQEEPIVGFWEKLSGFGKKAGVKLCYIVLLLYYMMKSPATSAKDRALIISALGYFISPVDGVPDGIPVIGFGDDLAVLLFVLRTVLNNITPEVMLEAKNKMVDLFPNIDENQLKELL